MYFVILLISLNKCIFTHTYTVCHYLKLCVPFIHQALEVESQVSGEAVQILWRYFPTFQPLQVHYIFLVMSHLKLPSYCQ